jgi:hypothetical protein
MAIRPKFYGKVIGGKFVFTDSEKQNYDSYMLKFKDGKDLELTIGPKYKKRTSGQPDEDTNFNGYLWGVVYKIIGDEIGEIDLNIVHNWAQIGAGNVKGMPDCTVIPKGTSDMSGGEFAEYCQKVRMWANTPGKICELGLNIPEPNECEY